MVKQTEQTIRADEAGDHHPRILELACGTGRLTFALADALAALAAAPAPAPAAAPTPAPAGAPTPAPAAAPTPAPAGAATHPPDAHPRGPASAGDTAEPGVAAIVGLDNDLTMLAAAERRARRRRQEDRGRPCPLLVASDMRRFALATRFHLAFVAYNSLQLLAGLGEMATCLGVARQHLAPGGLVGVEVTDFQAGGADGAAGERPELLGQADGIRLWGRLVHDLAARTSCYQRRFAGDDWSLEDEVVVRSIDRIELEAVLKAAGLVPIQWWENGPTLRAIASAR